MISFWGKIDCDQGFSFFIFYSKKCSIVWCKKQIRLIKSINNDMRLRSMLEKLIREWLPRLWLRNLRSRLEMWWMFWRIWWRRFQGGWVRAIRWVCENWGLSAWVCPVRESKSRRSLIRERSRRKLFFCLQKVLNLNWKRSLLSIKNSSSAFLFFSFLRWKLLELLDHRQLERALSWITWYKTTLMLIFLSAAILLKSSKRRGRRSIEIRWESLPISLGATFDRALS